MHNYACDLKHDVAYIYSSSVICHDPRFGCYSSKMLNCSNSNESKNKYRFAVKALIRLVTLIKTVGILHLSDGLSTCLRYNIDCVSLVQSGGDVSFTLLIVCDV